MSVLSGKTIAVLAEDVYEDLELWYPYYRLLEAGAEVRIVAPELRTYQSKHGYPAKAEVEAARAKPDDYEGVVIPGGYAPDRLRRYTAVLDLVREIFEAGDLVSSRTPADLPFYLPAIIEVLSRQGLERESR